jgi:hypothetical protein
VWIFGDFRYSVRVGYDVRIYSKVGYNVGFLLRIAYIATSTYRCNERDVLSLAYVPGTTVLVQVGTRYLYPENEKVYRTCTGTCTGSKKLCTGTRRPSTRMTVCILGLILLKEHVHYNYKYSMIFITFYWYDIVEMPGTFTGSPFRLLILD